MVPWKKRGEILYGFYRSKQINNIIIYIYYITGILSYKSQHSLNFPYSSSSFKFHNVLTRTQAGQN